MDALVARRLGVLSLVAALAGALLATPPANADTDRGSISAAGVAAQDEHTIEPRNLDAACPEGRVPDGDFPDPLGNFERAIDCLVWYEVTQGRDDGTYGTNASVRRGQMALFLYRLLDYNLGGEPVPGADVPHSFTDVGDRGELATAINALSSDELAEFLDLEAPPVRGYADDTYRPGSSVERAQMASFVARIFEGLLTVYDGQITQQGGCTFTDSSEIPQVHRAGVNTVCGFGIATGRADDSFRPRDAVTRGQMAAFLMRTQDILADEPFYALLPDQDVVVVNRDDCADAEVFCTIQEGVDAADGGTDRVLVVSSEDLYVEDVDLGSDHVELFGVPIVDEDDRLLFPGLDGTFAGDGNDRVLLGRIVVLPDDGDTGISLTGGGDVALASLLVDGGDTGIDVVADRAMLDAVGVNRAHVAVSLDVDAGDIRGGDLRNAEGAFVVDVGSSLDLEDILERTTPGIRNFFFPAAELGEFADAPAIVPAD
jgi:hypothetical protein